MHRIVEALLMRLLALYYRLKKMLVIPYLKEMFYYCYLKYHGVQTKFGYVTLVGLPIIEKKQNSSIIIEKGVTLVSNSRGNVAGVNHPVILATLAEGAVIHLKSGCGVSGSSICAVNRVELGENSGLGANSSIYDTDFHVADSVFRRKQKSILEAKSGPVIVGKDVWVCANVQILKGVKIGSGAVIGTGSIVIHSVLENAVVAGNPARDISDDNRIGH